MTISKTDLIIAKLIIWLDRTGLKGRKRIIKCLSHLISGKKTMSTYGVWLAENWQDATFQFAALGHYGENISNYIKALPNNTIFLDIGGNTGLFSLIADNFSKAKAVYCFEPNPSLFEKLKTNTALNGNRINILNFGIGDHNGTIGFETDHTHSGKGRISKSGASNISIEIQDYTAFNTIADRHEQADFFCKIDVEGFEFIVIEQILKSNISSRLSGIITEIDERFLTNEQVQTICERLKKIGLQQTNKLGEGHHYDLVFTKR